MRLDNNSFRLAESMPAMDAVFLAWNYISTKRHQQSGGGNISGLGGKADPLSGTTSGMRDPEEMRQAMDNATARRREPR